MKRTCETSPWLVGMVFRAAASGLAQEQPRPTMKAEANTSGKAEIPATKILLPKGTPVRLFLMEPISTRTAKAGDSIKLQVLGPMKVDNLVVIANKAPASATITEVHTRSARDRDVDIWPLRGLKVHLDSATLIDLQKQPLQC